MSDQYVLDPATKGKVVLETTAGPIDIELFSRECPLACRNFVQLCMEGYYNGCEFHRLVRDFIVQTGDPSGTGHGGESIYGGDVFKTELHQRLKFRNRGYLGMASDKKDQNMSQFFFTLGPAPELSGKHTLFGKVTGKTIFNLTKLNEYEVDKNERPSYVHKITGAKILENPFNDIKPRKLAEERKRKREREEREKPKKSAVPAKKNTALLSFGDEMDEEEEQISHLKLKGKSAHDVLDDEFLSRQAAVEPEELGAKGPEFEEAKVEEDQGEREQRLGRIKEKFSKPKTSKRAKFDDLDDEDLDQMLDDQKEAEKKQQMEEITSELKQLQKEYKKSMRVPKADKSESDEAGTSGGMKMYNKLKLKFKSGTKDIVKTVDPKREEQTIALLDRFRTKLDRASVHGVLWDKKVDMSDQKTQEEVILATSEEQGKIDLDAEDIQGEDWMDHELHAPEDTSGVTKARDANRKEEDDEWYPINDPRNKLNVRRRTQGGQVPDLFANAEPMAMP